MPRKERSFAGPALIWKRILAFLIDIFILMIFVFFPFRKYIAGMIPKDYSFSQAFSLSKDSEFTGSLVFIYVGMMVLIFMYFYLLERKTGQTIGKRIMKLYVVGYDNEFKKWKAAVRNLMFIPIFPFDLLMIVDPLFMFFTKTNQRLTEILSKTKVIQSYEINKNYGDADAR